ncbi:uncharacterized protein EV154DRAFT_498324 [Mucor mucedo]|uniref:uncharacterized protein n=1 Tax=Mucor mucedo TaxID=29922 RepID=UPI00222106FF|nr:uncharacterized protein EV154DRAFT_498324 [Mucor mucedo]KAI7894615.1 hypothetical protein EV154DRAFT_498324 [Mucor mucedo]
MFTRFLYTIVTVSLLSSVNAYGMVAQVVDANDFCVFLPPDDATDRIISDSEWNANAFCMGSTPLATDAGTLPSGFIKSAHYVKTDLYVQVTGQMDYTKANLDGTDGGGQMDVKAPVGSSCVGWDYYVNLIEPTTNTYCMRCCNDTVSCNRGISEKGCAHIIPGDYSGPNDGTGSSLTSTEASTIASSTAATSTESATVISTTTAESIATTVAPATSAVVSSSAISREPVSSSATAVSSSSSAISTPSGAVSAQDVSSASSSAKPVVLAIGASVLVAAANWV